MKILDPGHLYELAAFDATETDSTVVLCFMKREGKGYPFNSGTRAGTNCQEVLRVLIDRTTYLDGQRPAPENTIILNSLRNALLAFEIRAARMHAIDPPNYSTPIEHAPTHESTGHTFEP